MRLRYAAWECDLSGLELLCAGGVPVVSLLGFFFGTILPTLLLLRTVFRGYLCSVALLRVRKASGVQRFAMGCGCGCAAVAVVSGEEVEKG